MKSSLLAIGILLLHLASCKPAQTTYEVNKAQLTACETGIGRCRPIEVVRQKDGSKTIVRFLISTNRVWMQLFDTSYPKQIAQVHQNSITPILSSYVKDDNLPAFDVTALPDGKYYVHIIGDEVGGIFELSLRTKS